MTTLEKAQVAITLVVVYIVVLVVWYYWLTTKELKLWA